MESGSRSYSVLLLYFCLGFWKLHVGSFTRYWRYPTGLLVVIFEDKKE